MMQIDTHPRALALVLASLLFAAAVPVNRLHADTTLDSGTTTVSTGTDFGAALFVGASGTATLELVPGADATSGSAYLGSATTGNGTAIVTGGTWTTLGDLEVVNGSLTMTGGRVAVGGRLSNTASGTINLNVGGTLQIGVGGTTGELATTGWLMNDGTLVFNRAGAVTYSGTTVGDGRFVNEGPGTVTIGGLVVAYGGATFHSGTIVVPMGGNVQNNMDSDPIVIGESSGDVAFVETTGGNVWGLATSLGRDAGSAGTVTLSAGGLAADLLEIGASGTGILNVAGGNANTQLCTIGANAGGVGTATVSAGVWYSYDDLLVGGSGTGTLNITGGTLFIRNGRLLQGASGTINLAPGGTITIGNGYTLGAGELAVPTLTNNGTLIFDRPDAVTYAGVISGSGAVIQQGPGTLSLTGSNTYTGTTMIYGGRLVVTTDSIKGPITNVASLSFDQSTDGNYSGMISGIGSVTKTGSGTLSLSAANMYTGATIVSEGTLQIGVGGTTGSLGGTSGIAVDGVLAINRSDALSLASPITGRGSIHHVGTGTTTLSGTNFYSGGTLVSAGRLVGDANSLPGDIVSDTAVEFFQAGTGTYAGMLTGSGVMEKTGGGTLILTGSSAMAGAVTISSGTLQLGDGSTLGSLGSTAITNNASLAIDCSGSAAMFVRVSGTGAFVKQGDGLLALSGTNASSGPTTIRSGVLTANAGGTWTTFGDLEVVNGSLTMTGGRVAVGGRLSNTASGTINLNVGGTLQIGVGGTTGELATTGWLMNDGTLVFNRAGAVTYSGTTVGDGRFVNEGPGTVTIGGLVVAYGGATFHSGTIVVPMGGNVQNNMDSDPIVIGESSGDVAFVETTGGNVWGLATSLGRDAGSAGTVTLSAGGLAADLLEIGASGTGILNVAGGNANTQLCTIGANAGGVGTATVSAGVWYSYDDLLVGGSGTGTLNITGGTLFIRNGRLLQGASGTINLAPGGTITIGNGYTLGAGELAVPTLTNNGTLIFDRPDAVTYAGVISGSGAVIQQGAGQLRFDGNNSYSGLTTIAGGTVALAGTGSIGTGGLNLGITGSPGVFDLSALTAGTYSLPATGSLAGVGTLTGNGKSLAVLGAFRPGNSPGTVTVDTGLTLDLSNATGTTFDITNPLFTAGSCDLVNGGGSLIFGGILNLNFSGGSYANGTDVLQLFVNTGGFSGDFTSVYSTGLAAGQYATFNASTGYISIVPEPSTYAMALAGLACGGYTMVRRRKRA